MRLCIIVLLLAEIFFNDSANIENSIEKIYRKSEITWQPGIQGDYVGLH